MVKVTDETRIVVYDGTMPARLSVIKILSHGSISTDTETVPVEVPNHHRSILPA
ncbi:hypothetical protein KBB05_02445 [Patescibacteria group bacterium]|nr:hypothetical protein [Patescibacteria group bacterium]